MANCPNCNSKISFKNIYNLYYRLDQGRLKCDQCKSTLLTNQLLLVIAFFIELGLAMIPSLIYLDGAFEILFGSMLLYFIIKIPSTFIKSRILKFSKFEKVKSTNLKNGNHNGPIDLIRVDNLKKMYSKKTNQELESITADDTMTEEAKVAAKELLTDKNVT